MSSIKPNFGGTWSFFASAPVVLWQVLFLVCPLVLLIGLSVLDAGTWQVTIQHYREIMSLPYLVVIARSVVMAVSVAVAALLMGYPVAYFLAFCVERWRLTLLFASTLPLWINFLIQVYSWFFILEKGGIVDSIITIFMPHFRFGSLINSTFAIFIVMVYCYVPFVIMSVYSVLEHLDARLIEASLDLGASPWQTFCRVTLPLSLPGIRTGGLLVLVPIFGEFSIITLLGGNRFMYVGPLISYLTTIRESYALGAAFVCVAGMVLFFLALLFNRALDFLFRQRSYKNNGAS